MVDVPGSSVPRSSVSDDTRAFDVSRESDLLALLNYIRRGPFEPGEKNNLRDVVLDYAITKDDAILEVLSTGVEGKGVVLKKEDTPVAKNAPHAQQEAQQTPVEQTPPTPSSPGFGNVRPAPSFAPSSVNQNNSVPRAREAADTAHEVRGHAAPPQPPEPAVSPHSEMPQQDNLDRIKEIKQLVNEKVGNPVNLIDVNNTVGREYMNALLNAMRVVGGNNQEEIKIAMDRLEKSYTAIIDSAGGGAVKASATPKPEPKAAPHADTAAQTDTNPTPPAPPSTPPTPPAPKPVPPPIASTPPAPPPIPKPVAPSTPPSPPPAPQAPPVPPATQAATPSSGRRTVTVPVSSAPLTPPPAPPKPPTHAPTPPPSPLSAESETQQLSPMQKLAAEVKLDRKDTAPKVPQKTVQANGVVDAPMSIADRLHAEQSARDELLEKRQQEREVTQAPTDGDPLYADEVAAGLNQLLSEWRLFKSSGIFGSGPGGSEHPLYKMLSNLPMAAVIAGRFEGATPEIKQSVTDYMNGWRYEQGVVHEMDETFEHYLRRVIRQILDKQKASKA